MSCYKDLQSACCPCSYALITNIIDSAGTISRLKLESILDNLKPLGYSHSGSIIVGSLATGAIIYFGHRWLSAPDDDPQQPPPEQETLKQEIHARLRGGGIGSRPTAEQEKAQRARIMSLVKGGRFGVQVLRFAAKSNRNKIYFDVSTFF